MICLTYFYELKKDRLEALIRIKGELGVPIAKQIGFALDYFLEMYDRDPQLKRDLLAYVKAIEKNATN